MNYVEWTALTLALTFYFAMIFLMLYLMFIPDIRAIKLRKILMSAINNNYIENIHDVYTLFKGVNNYHNSTSNNRQEIGKTLRRLNLYLVKKLDKLKKEDDIKKIKASLSVVKELLKENDEITPFSELPAHERFVIEDAKSFLRNEDWESADRKINEIANFLLIANERKNTSDRQSKLSFTLTVASILITVVLAVWKF